MITIYDWFGYDIPIEERYQMIHRAGFDGVLLWWNDALHRGDYRSGPSLARKAGLFVENIHTPFQVQDDIWLDNLDGEASLACYLQCISDCREFEIPTMVVHLPDEDKPWTALGLTRIRKIADAAEQSGVNVALENLWNLPNLAYMLDQVNSRRIGFCYDCAHHYRYYPELDLLSQYGSRLMALHLHDNKGKSMHRLPLDGTVDWAAAMKNIALTGYSGPTAIESMNWDYADRSAEEFLARAYHHAKRLEELRHA